jgi:integrase
MSRDLHFDQILGVLADLGAGPEQVSAVAQSYLRRPGPEPVEHSPITGNNCAETTEHVSLGRKNMPKHKIPNSLHQKGHIQWRNGVARLLARESVLKPDGSIKRELVPFPLGRVSPEEAEQRRVEIIAQLASQTTPMNCITVKEFIEQRFFPDHVSNLRLATRRVYKSILYGHIVSAYGDTQLRHLGVLDLQRLCNLKRDKGYSAETLKHIKAYSSAFLEYAKDLGIITSNPARAIRLPRRHDKNVRVTPDEAQAGNLLAVVRRPAFRPIYEMVFFSCCTSVHYAEMAGLRIRRLNLTSEAIIADGQNLPAYSVAIREDYYRGEFGPTKNKGRERIEGLASDLVPRLLAHLARSQFLGPDDLVFCDEAGKPMDEDKTRRKLVAACKEAGIPRLGWHAFRRYFATQSDREEMHQVDRQNSLGHSSQEMTAHYTTEDLKRRQPHVERIARGLLAASGESDAVTSPLPRKTK